MDDCTEIMMYDARHAGESGAKRTNPASAVVMTTHRVDSLLLCAVSTRDSAMQAGSHAEVR